MLQIIHARHQLDFGKLMRVYAESNATIGAMRYPHLDAAEQLLEVEQDQHAFLREFFKIPGAFIAVWSENGCYQAALRVEPYSDGVLLEGIETAPENRRRGYAKRLMQNTLIYLCAQACEKIYSHVDKKNFASLSLHESCGFRMLYDHAAFVDGSVDHRTFTYFMEIKKQGAV